MLDWSQGVLLQIALRADENKSKGGNLVQSQFNSINFNHENESKGGNLLWELPELKAPKPYESKNKRQFLPYFQKKVALQIRDVRGGAFSSGAGRGRARMKIRRAGRR